MGDTFAGIREASQAKRASNRETSTQRLLDAGLPFVSKNGGAHLIVKHRVDFWPGTGLWRDRQTPDTGRGIRSLLKHMEKVS